MRPKCARLPIQKGCRFAPPDQRRSHARADVRRSTRRRRRPSIAIGKDGPDQLLARSLSRASTESLTAVPSLDGGFGSAVP
jgi:hypothetical protein